MSRRYIRTSSVSLLILFELSLAQAQTPREIAQYAFPSIVVILAENEKGKIISLGSGFFVGNDAIATNHHVIKGALRLYAKIVGQKKVYVVNRILATDITKDLAILKITGVTASSLSLGEASRIGVGDEVYVVGNPQGLEGTFSQGVISGIRLVKGKSYLQITAPISPGSSGGPVLNTSGEVIGVAVGTLRGGQNLNFAVPVSDLKSLLARLPDNIEANVPDAPAATPFNRGYKPYTSPRIEKEIGEQQSLIRANLKSAEAHFKLAEIYRHWHRKTESIQSYQQAIRIKPTYAEAYYGLAESYMLHLFSRLVDARESEKQAKLAIEAYKQAIRIVPDYVEAHVGLGNAYSNLERYDEAIEAFQLALAVKPDTSEAYYGLGFAHKEKEQYPEAIKAFTRLTRINNEDNFAYEELGHIYAEVGEYDDAIKSYNKAISTKRFADGGREYYGLWEAYRLSGRLSEGVQNFKQLVITAKKKLESSDSDMMKVENTRNLAWAHLSLGIMYVRSGDKASALEQYKAIKALGSDGMVVSHANQLFNEIYK